MKGIIVNIDWRGGNIPAAFMKVTDTGGDEAQGWHGQCRIWFGESAHDAGLPCIDQVPIRVPGKSGVAGPMGGGSLPKAGGAQPATPAAWNPNPVEALYGVLLETYPDAKQVA